jgi:tetratricopeptide (TPR) repeat protein
MNSVVLKNGMNSVLGVIEWNERSMQGVGAAAAAWLVLWAGTAVCEDVVHAAVGENSRARTRLTGEVLDYTGTTLVMRVAGGAERAFPAERVFLIETERTPEHVRGDKLAGQFQCAAALSEYRAALDREQRRWVRREILSTICRCHRELGEYLPAAQNFLLLVASDPTTPYFASIPLAWEPGEPTAELAAAARQWLGQTDNAVAALIGASHLLATSHAAEASARLKQLAFDRDPRVAWLARAQSWRSLVQTANELRLESWASDVEKAPEELRAGGYFVLGQALAQRREHERAALALLRVPVLYRDHRSLSARALLAAAGQLEKIGQASEAENLYRELTEEFADTAAGREAAERRAGTVTPQPAAAKR